MTSDMEHIGKRDAQSPVRVKDASAHSHRKFTLGFNYAEEPVQVGLKPRNRSNQGRRICMPCVQPHGDPRFSPQLDRARLRFVLVCCLWPAQVERSTSKHDAEFDYARSRLLQGDPLR